MVEEVVAAQVNESATMTGASDASVFHSAARMTASKHRPVLLSHPVEGAIAITGVAVLSTADDPEVSVPARLATELSKRLSDFGDVSRTLLVV
jgi:hypothetical protein